MVRILIADDDTLFLTALSRAFSRSCSLWTIKTVQDGQQALTFLCSEYFDAAVLELRMPHLNGLQVLTALRRKGLQTPVIILTGYGTIEDTAQAFKNGVQDFIAKPIDIPDVIHRVQELISSHNLPPHVLAESLDRHIKSNLGDPGLDAHRLCRHFTISYSYMARLFKDHLGMPFRRRLAWHRVERARELLEGTDRPIGLIADACGFRNQTRLFEAFRKLKGTPPRKYREICRGLR